MDQRVNTAAVGNEDELHLENLMEKMDEANLYGFWGSDEKNKGDADEKLQRDYVGAVPYIWKYRDLYKLLCEAGDLVSLDVSTRRSLILQNPGLKPLIATTTNHFCGYRINLPGENMPPHRHSVNASRFGLVGSSNFTGIDGEHITFGPGDLVLTPSYTWHNHGNNPTEESVNMSLLDMPLTHHLNVTKFEGNYREEINGEMVAVPVEKERFKPTYSQDHYGTGGLLPRFLNHRRGPGTCSPMFVYRWDEVHKLLTRIRDDDGSPYEGIVVQYINPVNGKSAYTTTAFSMQLLRPGEKLLPMRQNASLICTPLAGRGRVKIGGQQFDWEPNDTFVVPAGAWLESENLSATEDAIIFIGSDEPVLSTLGFYSKQGRDRNGDIVRLESSSPTDMEIL